jgi:hypothetical protein
VIVAGGTAVRFTEEQGGAERIFDFAAMPVKPEVREWLVRVFARRILPPAAVRRIKSAEPAYRILARFADILAGDPAVSGAAGVTARHLEAFRDQYAGLSSQLAYVDILRGLLRADPELPPETRAAVVALRPGKPAEPPAAERPAEYADGEWQQITTALRRDVRTARDRIRAGRDLLLRYRAGQLEPGSRDEETGRYLDVFDRTGDFPRAPRGVPLERVQAAGGVARLAMQLTLTVTEMTAFALLLTAVTGENFGTVAAWPAASFRPDGGAGDTGGVALIEASKPRRGPDREHMVTALEDLPAGPARVLPSPAEDGERRLFRSPLRLYELLVDLTELSRRHGGHQDAFCAYTASPAKAGKRWPSRPESFHVWQWASGSGFPSASHAVPGGPPPVNVRWLRNTALARARRPVAHTRATLNDRYLMSSDQVARESRTVVAQALRDEVGKARSRQSVQVLTAEFFERAMADPDAAAAEAGLPPGTVAALVSGRSDTVLAGCTGHTDSPHAPAGTPCTASFLECLGCPNARALPRHLPVQVTAADQILALRPNMDPAAWQARYATPLACLDDILGHYTTAERQQARTAAVSRQRELVGQLLDGRWDLR